MIKAVIFDLNGVFVKSEKYLSTRLQEDFNIPEKKFWPVLDKVLNEARQKNNKDTFVLLAPHLENFGLKFTKDEFWDYWFKYEHEVPEMLELSKRLKATGIKIFILSNNFWERAENYKKNFSFSNLKEIVDKIYFSFETGYIKPDPRAFTVLMDEHRLKPHECVYFDNSQANIMAATKLGITAFLFENPQTTGSKIKDLIKIHENRD